MKGIQLERHLLDLVQEVKGFSRLYYGALLTTPDHVVALHHLIEEVATMCLIGPIVGLTQHWVGNGAEQLSNDLMMLVLHLKQTQVLDDKMFTSCALS